MSFLLTKWYLDAITDRGEARIGYSAQLRVAGLDLGYASTLAASVEQAPRVTSRIRGARLPEHDGDGLRWRVPGLELDGRWTPDAHPPLRLELLDPPGLLTWSCLMPRARVVLTHGAANLSARGYAECVTLKVPPWKLPIDELHWGRAHVGPHTVVWIDWRGPKNTRRIYVDGEAVDGEVSAEQVVTPRLHLKLEPRRTLRDGDVSRTAFSRLPAIIGLLSRNKLKLIETKWLSVARAGREQGWAIHEVVRWD